MPTLALVSVGHEEVQRSHAIRMLVWPDGEDQLGLL